MIFIVINFIFNGFILGCFYNIAYAFTNLASTKTGLIPEWVFYTLGYVTSGVFTLIGISAIGHAFIRLFIGARKPIQREKQKFEPLLIEVLEKMNSIMHTDFKIENMHILIKDVKEPNAQALGSDTIIITDGLLKMASDDELKGVLAHEVGHLYYKDSVILIAILFGSFATRVCAFLTIIYTAILSVLTEFKGYAILLVFLVVPILFLLPLVAINWVGQKLLNLSLLFMGRRYEYRADKLAKDLGYEIGLISFLEKVQAVNEHDNSFLGRIVATHPVPMKRIGRLEESKESVEQYYNDEILQQPDLQIQSEQYLTTGDIALNRKTTILIVGAILLATAIICYKIIYW